jgi:hypothetical protein
LFVVPIVPSALTIFITDSFTKSVPLDLPSTFASIPIILEPVGTNVPKFVAFK